MGKSKKTLYVVSSLVIGVCSVLLVLFGFILFGGVNDSSVDLVFVSDTRDFIYDGYAHGSDGWQLAEGKLRKGHTAKVKVTGSQRDVGTGKNAISVVIYDKNGNDITETYNIELREGNINVLPRPIEITTVTDEKIFDGYPLYNRNWDVSNGRVADGQYLDVSLPAERTEIGVSKNAAIVIIRDSNYEDVSENYDITVITGELTVKPIPVEISTKSMFKVYDGEPLTCDEWSLNSTLLEGDYIQSVIMPATITERGAVENYISEIIINRADGSRANYYELNCRAGTLAVMPRVITVRSGDAVKAYDGTPLTCGDWQIISITQPLEGHVVEVAISGTRTEAGESPNDIAQVVISDVLGKDVTYNYDVRYHTGTLVVIGNVGGGNGSGNTVGSGGSSLDDSGTLEGDSDENPDGIAFRFNADTSGDVYFRLKSFGNFSGNSWQDIADYGYIINDKYSANYLAGAALACGGYDRTHIRIESLSNDYILPSYLDTSDGDYEIQKSDVLYTGDTSKVYGLNCYFYDYVKRPYLAVDPHIYENYEIKYHIYTYREYLTLTSEEDSFLRTIINENGWSTYDPKIVEKVANYVKSAADYNLNYDKRLDKENDVAIAFLRDYKQGVCRHYATAATLLFRALGIPARYTVGYKARASEGDWVDVAANQAHAWVEIYVSGFGWATVEVTGATAGEEAPDGRKKLNVKPVNLQKKYDGTVLTHSGEVQGLSTLTALGYTYRAKVSGRQTTVGASECAITSFTLYDPNGDDVTDNFNIKYSTGKLQLYLAEINVVTYGGVKYYDGTPLEVPNASYIGKLLDGHRIRLLTATGSITNVGKKINLFDIYIEDQLGVDVTDVYKINAEYGYLEILPRKVIIIAGSAEKRYDGTALICKEFKYEYEGAAEFNDTIRVAINGSQVEIGYSENVVTAVKIIDSNGKDVTDNYYVITYNGLLTVTY